MKAKRVTGRRRAAKKGAGRPTLEAAALVDERILEAAASVFLEEGFARAKMDAIAARAGITKQTVYARFASKDALFRALASRFSAIVFPWPEPEEKRKQSPRTFLMEFARGVVRVLLEEKSQRLFTVLAAEARAFPELASATWVDGPGRLRKRLLRFFEEEIAAGRMAMAKPEFAAEQFLGLLVGPIHGRLIFGRPSFFEGDEQAAAYLEACVDLFLERYLTSAGRRACRR